MEIWIATGNKGKLEEFKLGLKDLPNVQVFSQADLKAFSPKPEDGQTFLENARIKARSLHAVKPEAWVIADDSGLEVHGLNNLPGVHSARYAGPHAKDGENTAKLLKMMQIRNVSPRTAQFKCVLVLISPQNEELIFEGDMKGSISSKPSGQLGFGYDPVFVPEGETQTLADLGPGFKVKKSHRAIALEKLLEEMKKRL